jgi:hypothetical protein
MTSMGTGSGVHRRNGSSPSVTPSDTWQLGRREETSMNDRPKSAKRTDAAGKTYEGFTDEERAAMKERAKELKAAAPRRG